MTEYFKSLDCNEGKFLEFFENCRRQLRKVWENLTAQEICHSQHRPLLLCTRDCAMDLITKFLSHSKNSRVDELDIFCEALFYASIVMLRIVSAIGDLNYSNKVANTTIIVLFFVKDRWLKYKKFKKAIHCSNICISTVTEVLNIAKNNHGDSFHISDLENTIFLLYTIYLEGLTQASKLCEAISVLHSVGLKNKNRYFRLAMLCLSFNIGLSIIKQKNYSLASKVLDICLHVGSDVFHLGDLQKLLYCILFSSLKQNKPKKWLKAISALQLCWEENDGMRANVLSAVKLFFVSNCIEKIIIDSNWKYLDRQTVISVLEFLDILPFNAFCRLITGCDMLSNIEVIGLLGRNLRQHFLNDDCKQASAAIEKIIQIATEFEPVLDMPCIVRISFMAADNAKLKCWSGDYEEALKWYHYSKCLIQLFVPFPDSLQKIFRHILIQISWCFSKLNYIDKANDILTCLLNLEEITTAELCRLCELSIATGNEILATNLVNFIDNELPQDAQFHLLLSTYFSCVHMESIDKKLLAKILERIYEHTTHNIMISCNILRCLLLISIQQTESGEKSDHKFLLNMLAKTFDRIKELQKGNLHMEVLTVTCQWLSKASWDQIKYNKLSPDLKFWYSSFSYDFLMLRFPFLEEADFLQMKSRLLFLFVTGLCTASTEYSVTAKTEYLRKMLHTWDITVKKEGGSVLQSIFGNDVRAIECYFLYYFEVNLQLKNEININFLSHLVHNAGNPIVLEKIAELVYFQKEYISQYRIAVRALEIVVNHLMTSAKPDFTRIAKDYMFMIEISIDVERHVKKKVDSVAVKAEDLAKLIQRNRNDIPQIQILHLMKKCWNHGIYYFTQKDLEMAMLWCNYSMFLIKRLKTFESMYSHKLEKYYFVLFNE